MLDLVEADVNMAYSDVIAECLVDNVFVASSHIVGTAMLSRLHEYLDGFGLPLTMGRECEPHDAWMCSLTFLN